MPRIKYYNKNTKQWEYADSAFQAGQISSTAYYEQPEEPDGAPVGSLWYDTDEESNNGGNVDLTGYATEQYVNDYAQPKGNYLTEHQDISGKLDASELPTAINSALAQAKASGEFNGADGKDGVDGKDGYTPVKGVDYFDGSPGKDGKDGNPGADGYTPVKGKDYFDGKDGQDGSPGKDGSDGVSATHSWNGTVLTVTSASGTSSADLKGAKGDKGDKGDSIKGDPGSNGKDGTSVTVKSVSESTEDGGSNVVTFSDGKTVTINNGKTGAPGKNGTDGYTPVKGVDYWTDADQEAIVQVVITALGTPVFGTVDADNTITLTGNLADGTYILKYEDAEGNLFDIGAVNIGDGYTNQIPISTDANGNIYNGVGYKPNARYSSSSSTDIEHNGCYITGYIPVTNGAVIRIANMTMDKNIEDGNKCFAYVFDANKANAKKIQVGTGGAYTFDGLQAVWNSSGHLTQFTVPSDGFVRLQASYIGVDSIVTVNEEITD